MARDTLLQNSEFLARRAAEGRGYTYQGLAGAVPTAIGAAQGVQDIAHKAQRATMEQALAEARLLEMQQASAMYAQELQLRQQSAQTRMLESQAALATEQARRQLLELQTERQRAEFPIWQEDGQWYGMSPSARAPRPIDASDPRVRAMEAGIAGAHAKAELDTARAQAEILRGQSGAALDFARADAFGAHDPSAAEAQVNRRFEAITGRLSEIDKRMPQKPEEEKLRNPEELAELRAERQRLVSIRDQLLDRMEGGGGRQARGPELPPLRSMTQHELAIVAQDVQMDPGELASDLMRIYRFRVDFEGETRSPDEFVQDAARALNAGNAELLKALQALRRR